MAYKSESFSGIMANSKVLGGLNANLVRGLSSQFRTACLRGLIFNHNPVHVYSGGANSHNQRHSSSEASLLPAPSHDMAVNMCLISRWARLWCFLPGTNRKCTKPAPGIGNRREKCRQVRLWPEGIGLIPGRALGGGEERPHVSTCTSGWESGSLQVRRCNIRRSLHSNDRVLPWVEQT